MQFRLGFVSNSSNASFVIDLRYLTMVQLQMIREHAMACKMVGIEEPGRPEDVWSIYIDEVESCIEGNTGMDNFDMRAFLKAIRVPEGVIKWQGN